METNSIQSGDLSLVWGKREWCQTLLILVWESITLLSMIEHFKKTFMSILCLRQNFHKPSSSIRDHVFLTSNWSHNMCKQNQDICQIFSRFELESSEICELLLIIIALFPFIIQSHYLWDTGINTVWTSKGGDFQGITHRKPPLKTWPFLVKFPT